MSDRNTEGFLRNVLYANAGFSGGTGLLMVLVPSAVGSWVGWSLPVLWVGIGLSLLGYAGALVLAARRAPTSAFVWWFVGLDAAWVAASFAVLSAGTLVPDSTGRGLISAVALVVAMLAGLQIYGLGASRGGAA